MANAFCSINPDSPRAADWQKVFGRLDQVPVTGWLPFEARLPGFAEPQRVYLLDISKLSTGELDRLAQHLAERFGQPVELVRQTLPDAGCPILADDTIFSTTDPLPLIMADDLDEDEDWEDDDEFYYERNMDDDEDDDWPF